MRPQPAAKRHVFTSGRYLETGNGADKALGSFDGIQPARGAESGADINARGSQTRTHIGTRRIDIGDQLDAGRDRRCHNLRGSLLRPAFRFTSDLSSVASSMASPRRLGTRRATV